MYEYIESVDIPQAEIFHLVLAQILQLHLKKIITSMSFNLSLQ